MAQYIDKDALIAELKKRISNYWSDSENTMGIYPYALEEVIKYVDSLEVKEVDLDKEYEEFVVDDPIFGNFITNDTMGMKLAKHFFELGLKAQRII